MKTRIKIDFAAFGALDKTDNWFWHTLRERFDVVLSGEPDFLFYSDGSSRSWRLHTCTRIYFSVERHLPDWRQCDYALTCHELGDPRNLRLPYYVLESDSGSLIKDDRWADRILAERRKFCGVVISNPLAKHGRRRVEFVEKLMRRAPVDSGGRWANNIGGPVPGGLPGKRAWLRNYRFNLAFENESLAGYTTEKITDAMTAGCVPVYWGNPGIGRDFNPSSFLDLARFPTDEAIMDRMLELEKDEAALYSLLREPWFPDNRPSPCYSSGRFLDFMERIVTTPITPVARRRNWLHPGRWTLLKRDKPASPEP